MKKRWKVSAGKSTFKRLSDELHGFFGKRLKDNTDPNDLVSLVWLGAGRCYAKKASLRHYLFCVARGVLAEHNRTQGRKVELVPYEPGALPRDLPDDSPGPETAEHRRAWSELVRACIPKISEEHRDVVRLSLDGLDSIQIAQQLGLPYNTTRSRLSRGRRQLERVLRSRLAIPARSG